MTQRGAVGVLICALLGLLLAGCAGEDQGSNTDPDLVDSVTVPENGICRELTPDDVAKPSNATKAVD